MGFEQLVQLKDFLADRPEWAFLTLSLVSNILLFRLLLKAKDAHLAAVERVIPIADSLQKLVEHAANKAKTRRGDSLPLP